MKRLYDQHIYPHLIYAITVWGSTDNRKTYLQPLIRIHKKIVRIICNKRALTHTLPLMNNLGILRLTSLYTLRTCIEMHAHIYANKPHRPMHDQAYTWTEQIHNHNTRRSNRKYCFLPSEKGRAHVNMEHFTRRYAQVWNSIPDDIRVEARKTHSKGS